MVMSLLLHVTAVRRQEQKQEWIHGGWDTTVQGYGTHPTGFRGRNYTKIPKLTLSQTQSRFAGLILSRQRYRQHAYAIHA